MKLPVAPPAWPELFDRYSEQVGAILANQLGAEVRGMYEHRDHLRHLAPPAVNAEQWWLGIKFAQQVLGRPCRRCATRTATRSRSC